MEPEYPGKIIATPAQSQWQTFLHASNPVGTRGLRLPGKWMLEITVKGYLPLKVPIHIYILYTSIQKSFSLTNVV